MRKLNFLVLLLFLPLLSGCATGNDGMRSKIDSLMHAYAGAVPGASLLVLRDGKPVVRRAYGLSDVENHVAATPATNYRLASVTKQFTASAVLLLREEGKLQLEDPVRKWLPELPDTVSSVTIRHLLTHTGGLIDYEDVMEADLPTQLHDADVLKILAGQRTGYFAPGTNYRYSNSGYALLALIVERASGQRFASFLHDRIFAPLGMRNTVAFEEGISSVTNRAFGHSEEKRRWVRTDQSSTSAVLGDGGIYSSIDDLALWDAALYDGRLLSDASRKLAFTPATHTDDPTVEYGMGWRITGETLWHSGETFGFRNVLLRYPQQHITIIVLTNRSEPEPPGLYRLALRIAELFVR